VTHRPTRIRRGALTGLTTASLSACALAAGLAGAHDHVGGAPGKHIKHVVIIFQENASFDHYFATYPYAKNTDGTRFVTRPDTPTVNGLTDGNSQFPERVNIGLHDFSPNQTEGLPTGLDPNA